MGERRGVDTRETVSIKQGGLRWGFIKHSVIKVEEMVGGARSGRLVC